MTQHTKTVLVQITSGQGPSECAFAVRKIYERFLKQAARHGLALETLDSISGPKPRTYNSLLLSVSGKKAEEFIKPWIGTIQWISESPYRPRHKRKNWFVGINTIAALPAADTNIEAKDIAWKAAKASGPGGQHVNTTDSAVQATHKPSGIQVTASEERSQHANKKRAIEKISAILLARMNERRKEQAEEQWKTHKELERGNAVKVFMGKEFKER